MARKLIFAIICIIGELIGFIEAETIYHDCQGSVSTTSDVETKQLNATVYCDFLFKTEKSRFLQASFDGFYPGFYGYADNIKIYDGDNKEVNDVNLDIADGSLVETVIFSRGPALLVSISKSLQRSFKLTVTSIDKKYADIRTSKYYGTVATPRYILSRVGSEKNVMMKNLMFTCRFTPELGSSLSINFSELSIGDETVQILPSNLTISSKSRTFRHNITFEEVSVLLDTYPKRFPRGEGFSMTFDVCGGTSSENQANVSLPTSLFYGFDEPLRCSYVYTCPSGCVPVLTLTIEVGSQSNISSIVEIYMDNELSTPNTHLHLKNFSESFVGRSSKIAVLLDNNSSESLMHPVVFANFSIRKIDCSQQLQGRTGIFSSETYDGKYPNNINCTYLIRGSTDSKIRLELVRVDLAQSDCGDSIEIEDHGNVTAKVCNSTTLSYTSLSNEVEIVFRTDDKGTAEGFTAKWEIIEDVLEKNDSYSNVKAVVLSGIAALLSVSVIGFISCLLVGKYGNRNGKTEIEPTVSHNVREEEARVADGNGDEGQVYVERDDGVYDCPWERRRTLQELDINYEDAKYFEKDTEYGSDIPDRQQQTSIENSEGHYEFAGSQQESKDEDTLIRDRNNYTMVQKTYIQYDNTSAVGLPE